MCGAVALCAYHTLQATKRYSHAKTHTHRKGNMSDDDGATDAERAKRQKTADVLFNMHQETHFQFTEGTIHALHGLGDDALKEAVTALQTSMYAALFSYEDMLDHVKNDRVHLMKACLVGIETFVYEKKNSVASTGYPSSNNLLKWFGVPVHSLMATAVEYNSARCMSSLYHFYGHDVHVKRQLFKVVRMSLSTAGAPLLQTLFDLGIVENLLTEGYKITDFVMFTASLEDKYRCEALETLCNELLTLPEWSVHDLKNARTNDGVTVECMIGDENPLSRQVWANATAA